MFLMLDPRFKSFHLVFSFVGQEEGVSIVDEYDRKTLYPMLLKCYHHLHPMTKSVGCVDQTCDENSSLDIFQHIVFTSEPLKELSTKELLIFRHCQVDPQRHQVSFSMVGKT
jgi:hypothetical protein